MFDLTSYLIRLRRPLAFARIGILYSLFCLFLFITVVALRNAFEQGAPYLYQPQTPLQAAASQIPKLGVTVALDQYETRSARLAALQQLRSAGFGWVRQRIDWAQIEPASGDFQWAESDAILADVKASGLVPIVVLDGSPLWARDPLDSGNKLAPPAQDGDFARFVAAFAVRYGDIVRFYQIWDEPNIAPHWGNRLVEPVNYARLLAAAAAAVRAADADAVILLAALAPTVDRGHTAIDEVYFLQRLYAAGAAPFFDAVAVQPFGFGTPPNDPRSRVDVLNFGRLRLIRRTMVAAGDGETPIWAIRFGWNRAVNNIWRTVTPERQILYVQEAVAMTAAWPWLSALGWAIDRPNAPFDDSLWGFALVTPNGAATPLLTALTQAATSPRLPVSSLAAPPVPSNTHTLDNSSIDAFLSTLWLGFSRDLRGVVLCILGMALVGWRSRQALRLLPIAQWQEHYRTSSAAFRVVVWAFLFFVYYFATWPPLIGLCWIAAAILILALPLDGMILVALLLPFHFRHKEINLSAVTMVVPPAQAALLCTIPAWLRTLCSKSRFANALPRHPGVKIAHGLATAWLGISLLAAVHVWHWPAYGAGLWSLVIVPLLIYSAGCTLVDNPGAWRAVVMALGLGGAIAALLGLIVWMDGGGVSVDGARRLMGLTFSPNQTALYLLRSLFVLIGIGISSRQRWHWGVGVSVVVVALMLTGSRGAVILGIPVGIISLLWLGGSDLRRWAPFLWGIAFVGVLVLVATILWGQRLQNSETVLQRFAIWQGVMELWRAYPWFGVGPGGFFWRYPAFIVPAAIDEPNLIHAHNVWLNFAAGWGGLGILWLLGFLMWLKGQCRVIHSEKGHWMRIGLIAAFFAAFGHAQVDAFAALPELAAWDWMVLSLLTSKYI